MKTAMGLIVSVLGGVLIYDGFKGRNLWNDILSVLRGQGLPAGTVTTNINAGGGVGTGQYGPALPINAGGGVGTAQYGPYYSTEQGPTAPYNAPGTNTGSPIPSIRGIVRMS